MGRERVAIGFERTSPRAHKGVRTRAHARMRAGRRARTGTHSGCGRQHTPTLASAGHRFTVTVKSSSVCACRRESSASERADCKANRRRGATFSVQGVRTPQHRRSGTTQRCDATSEQRTFGPTLQCAQNSAESENEAISNRAGWCHGRKGMHRFYFREQPFLPPGVARLRPGRRSPRCA